MRKRRRGKRRQEHRRPQLVQLQVVLLCVLRGVLG